MSRPNDSKASRGSAGNSNGWQDSSDGHISGEVLDDRSSDAMAQDPSCDTHFGRVAIDEVKALQRLIAGRLAQRPPSGMNGEGADREAPQIACSNEVSSGNLKYAN